MRGSAAVSSTGAHTNAPSAAGWGSGRGKSSPSNPELVLLIGAARSGTTLLRLILDSHPEIGCPAEAGIPTLIGSLARTWTVIDSDSGQPEPPDRLSTSALEEVRHAATAPMASYCQRERKRIYCDKSLDSVHHLDLVKTVMGETRTVVLVRHVLDVIASGLEASPWGFPGYGFTPFVQAAPDNFVLALTNYWTSHVGRAIRWRDEHPTTVHCLRYEDLVESPDSELTKIWKFLEVDHNSATVTTALTRARDAGGPGDYKVGYTSRIHSDSVGRGRTVPIELLPPPALAAANHLLVQFGYEQIESHSTLKFRSHSRAHADRDWGAELSRIMASAAAHRRRDSELPPIALLADDHEELRWVIRAQQGKIRAGDGNVETAIVGSARDLVALICGEENPGVLLRMGYVRYVAASGEASHLEVMQTINAVRETPDGELLWR